MRRFLLVFAMFLIFTRCYAEDIVIDGDFSDWTDKPSVNAADKTEVEIKVTDEATQRPQADPVQTQPPETTAVQVQEPKPSPVQTQESVPSPVVSDAPVQSPADSTLPQEAVQDGAQMKTQTVQPADNLEAESTGDKNGNGTKYKISQLKWMLSENSDILYLMVRLSHQKDADETEVRTEMVTDFGNYDVITTYDTSDGTVFSTIGGTNITSNDGKCSEINKETVYLEYGIPIGKLIENMRWGYMIKLKVHTEDDTEPKKDYIIISTASTGPVAGAALCLAIAGAGYYLKRKKKTK